MIREATILINLLILAHFSTAQVSQGGGDIPIPVPEHPCLSPEAYIDIDQEIKANRALLIEQGILPAQPDGRAAVKLEWPLKQANGFDQPSYYTTVNFVDLDPSTGIQDFQCNSRSYNGHNGLDISLWPFWWQMMEDNQVEIIAGAPGMIINKSDNYFDHNCSCVGTWNAVYIQHSDGSVAWYGHMKKNSQTAKPIGASVVTGEFLGIVGSSGCSTNPHLHLEIHDASNNVIETYEGPCNATTPSSWWANQKPYYDPSINRLTTHGIPAEMNGFCPDDEFPNLQDQFDPGDLVYFTVWYRDQLLGEKALFKVIDPTGSVFKSWEQSGPANYAWAWWWWSYFLPGNAVEGIWTFESTYGGTTRSHPFQVGEVSAIHMFGPDEIRVLSNPVRTDLALEWKGQQDLQFSLTDLYGRSTRSGLLSTGIQQIPMTGLPSGAYVLQVIDPGTGKIWSSTVIKVDDH
ncbi:MAG: peptidoglycan DD-metalloendopeptidase family protein [Saprospiraceae bacterium]|nr:peptidoglycan DD-metalloendopeptidase family protein [Saprospiraceae bacterium]